jgi:colanic acid/amylovoran biosynthesis glycosyltransferase
LSPTDRILPADSLTRLARVDLNLAINAPSQASDHGDDAVQTLLLVTTRFPYLPYEEFLETEVPYLAKNFHRLIIVPSCTADAIRPVPDGVTVDVGYARRPRQTIVQKAATLARYPELLGRALSRAVLRPRAFKRAIAAAWRVAADADWFEEALTRTLRPNETAVVFCWWMTTQVLAVRIAARKARRCVFIISRPQRYDLYIDDGYGASWPFYPEVLRAIDKAFVASQHGSDYIVSRFPWMAPKVEVERLAVEDRGEAPAPAEGSKFVVTSCAYLNPVKRVHLLLEALAIVARQHPNLKVAWHHFGDGPLGAALEARARDVLPANVAAVFHGRVDNDVVLSFYRSTPINVFVNTSSSEGVPVSIMEAQCAGIPVIATAVCGTPELVNNRNGMLLPADPTVEDVAGAIRTAVEDPEGWSLKRQQTRLTWSQYSNAALVYSQFANHLAALSREITLSDPPATRDVRRRTDNASSSLRS